MNARDGVTRDDRETVAREEDFDHSWLICQTCGEIGIHKGRARNPPICPQHGADTLAVYVRLDEVGERDQLVEARVRRDITRQIEAAALDVGKQYEFGPEPNHDAYVAAHTDDKGQPTEGYTQDGYLEAVGRDLLIPVLARVEQRSETKSQTEEKE